MASTVSRIALVTGAGSGVGAAVSLMLASQGFHVVLAGRHIESLEEVASKIASAGHSATAIVADIADPTSTGSLFSQIRATFGRLDLLFNNAGTNARTAPLEEVPVEEWISVMNTNVTGTFLCTQEAFRLMRSQIPMGGRIINNGSISATTPRPNSAPYTASKHAISGLTKATALEGRKYNIACGQIDIGNAATAIGSHASRGALQPDGSVRVEPMLAMTHVTEAIKYMASLPLEANTLSLTVMATAMPFSGRG